jgi:hypothetical protein
VDLQSAAYTLLLQVWFRDISVEVLGVRLLTKAFKDVYRLWDMTFLDSELR